MRKREELTRCREREGRREKKRGRKEGRKGKAKEGENKGAFPLPLVHPVSGLALLLPAQVLVHQAWCQRLLWDGSIKLPQWAPNDFKAMSPTPGEIATSIIPRNS